MVLGLVCLLKLWRLVLSFNLLALHIHVSFHIGLFIFIINFNLLVVGWLIVNLECLFYLSFYLFLISIEEYHLLHLYGITLVSRFRSLRSPLSLSLHASVISIFIFLIILLPHNFYAHESLGRSHLLF
jgi:hypothetical protein